jgi:chitin synthase
MFTSFLQYLLLTPTYINILNVYAFCNTHDITWGTKGDDKPSLLPNAKLISSNVVEVEMPETDLDTQYEAELASFATKWEAPQREQSFQERHEDYYKGFRSAVVLIWMFCNLALAAVVLNVGGLDRIRIKDSIKDGIQSETKDPYGSYLGYLLWSVAALSAFRFVGAVSYLIIRMVRGI